MQMLQSYFVNVNVIVYYRYISTLYKTICALDRYSHLKV